MGNVTDEENILLQQKKPWNFQVHGECNGRRKHITTTKKALEFPRTCEITVGMRSMTPLKQHKLNLNPEENDTTKYQTYENENKEDMATHRQIASQHRDRDRQTETDRQRQTERDQTRP